MCTCSNGSPAGTACTTHGSEMCDSCAAGHYIYFDRCWSHCSPLSGVEFDYQDPTYSIHVHLGENNHPTGQVSADFAVCKNFVVQRQFTGHNLTIDGIVTDWGTEGNKFFNAEPGVYDYSRESHPESMKGTITVIDCTPCTRGECQITGNDYSCNANGCLLSNGDVSGFTGDKCDDCAVGSGFTSGKCEQCEVGYYNPTQHSDIPCIQLVCDHGYGYKTDWDRTTPNNCVKCGDNQIGANGGKGACVDVTGTRNCSSGTYEKPGGDWCDGDYCLSGTFESLGAGLSMAKTCPFGEGNYTVFCSDGIIVGDESVCNVCTCPNGVAVTDCGYHDDIHCASCDSGYILSLGMCCPPGQHRDGMECVLNECDTGELWVDGCQQLASCPAGYYQDGITCMENQCTCCGFSGEKCDECAVGSGFTSGKCEQCEVGYYNPTQHSDIPCIQLVCDHGYGYKTDWDRTTPNNCVKCGDNQIGANGGKGACVDVTGTRNCSSGTYEKPGGDWCDGDYCLSGTFESLGAGLSMAKTCPFGEGNYTVFCSDGTFVGDTSPCNVCTCPNGSVDECGSHGDIQCASCDSGYNLVHGMCCPTGHHRGRMECRPNECDSGELWLDGCQQLAICPAGYYQDGITCVPCPSGVYKVGSEVTGGLYSLPEASACPDYTVDLSEASGLSDIRTRTGICPTPGTSVKVGPLLTRTHTYFATSSTPCQEFMFDLSDATGLIELDYPSFEHWSICPTPGTSVRLGSNFTGMKTYVSSLDSTGVPIFSPKELPTATQCPDYTVDLSATSLDSFELPEGVCYAPGTRVLGEFDTICCDGLQEEFKAKCGCSGTRDAICDSLESTYQSNCDCV